jgi:hypothetical protein
MHPACVATARCRLAARPLAWLPPSSSPPFIIRLPVSLQLAHLSLAPGSTTVAVESSSVLCRNRAAILVVLIAFGAICHAQMTHQYACEAELAKCQAVLGAVGVEEAEGFVQLAAIVAETGTPSSASKGARLRSSPPPIRTDCIDARVLCVCVRRVNRVVQGRVSSPS